jgi:hypothetical protein
MQLSADELTRLEMMFRSCQVRSDPPILSDTDRRLDAMRRSECASDNNAPRREASSRSDSRPSWATARTLDELIHIRRGLMRNEEQHLERAVSKACNDAAE